MLFAALLLPLLAMAQPEVVHWSAKTVEGKPGPNAKVTVSLSAKIDEGWHLYALPPAKAANIPTTITAVAPVKVDGEVSQGKPITKMDANFGAEVDYFESKATFKVPVVLGPKGLDGATLNVKYQACDDSTCLPPKTVKVVIKEGQSGPISWTATVTDMKGSEADVELTAEIGEGWHLYSLSPSDAGNIPTSITAVAPLTLVGTPKQPSPITKMDPNFGAEVEYFEESATFNVHVKAGAQGFDGAKLKVKFQACNASTCMPPATVEVPIDGSSATPATAPAAGQTAMPSSAADQRLAAAKSEGLLPFMAFAFGAGLLALLTPCVFPMVPITVSFFAKRREEYGAKAGLGQAAAYCLGIIGAFTAFGLLVTALFGASGIQRFATNPWVNLAIGVLFVVLAINLFGFYEIKVPSGLANKFSPQGKAGLLAPILMGLTFTITSFTCTVPFVGTILVSAASGDWVYPFFGMLAFGTAFSLPFFLLALFPQFLASLPRAGAWMASVKGFMGFLELAAAIKFFSNADLVWDTGILDRERFLVVWLLIGLASIAFLFGWLKLPHASMPSKIGRGRMAIIGLTCLALAGVAGGIFGRSLGEMEAFLPPSHSGWIEQYKEGQRLAVASQKPMFINFTGVTCTNCRWMEKNMFPREDVTDALSKYVKVELFTDRETPEDQANQALQQKLAGTVALPVYLIVSPDGTVLKKFESSTRDSDEFVTFLKSVENSTVASM
jgi:thiol:disulfide interchange protein DsbD